MRLAAVFGLVGGLTVILVGCSGGDGPTFGRPSGTHEAAGPGYNNGAAEVGDGGSLPPAPPLSGLFPPAPPGSQGPTDDNMWGPPPPPI